MRHYALDVRPAGLRGAAAAAAAGRIVRAHGRGGSTQRQGAAAGPDEML